MADDTIDLTVGEPDESPSARRRRARRSESSKDDKKSGPTDADNRSLTGRLDTAFVKLSDQLNARGDEELSTALREERHAMSQGLVSATASVPFLRTPLILFLALLEPILAFWRVGRIVVYRLLAWRERRIVAMQERQAEWERQQAEAGAPLT